MLSFPDVHRANMHYFVLLLQFYIDRRESASHPTSMHASSAQSLPRAFKSVWARVGFHGSGFARFPGILNSQVLVQISACRSRGPLSHLFVVLERRGNSLEFTRNPIFHIYRSHGGRVFSWILGFRNSHVCVQIPAFISFETVNFGDDGYSCERFFHLGIAKALFPVGQAVVVAISTCPTRGGHG